MARLGVTACAEVATCRNMVVEKGLGALLGIGTAVEGGRKSIYRKETDLNILIILLYIIIK